MPNNFLFLCGIQTSIALIIFIEFVRCQRLLLLYQCAGFFGAKTEKILNNERLMSAVGAIFRLLCWFFVHDFFVKKAGFTEENMVKCGCCGGICAVRCGKWLEIDGLS